MKVRCSQCGASLAVLEREFYLRCPHCGARNLLRSPGESTLLVLPAKTEDQIRRLFPAGADLRTELRFYPYREVAGHLQPFYNHPVPELAGYVPPAGAATIFSEDAVDPDDLIPMAEEPSGSRVVFHPFYVVYSTDTTTESAIHIDAVSGLRPGPGAGPGGSGAFPPSRSFFTVLAYGVAFSALVYALAIISRASTPTAMALSIVAAFAGSLIAVFFKVLR
jgi:DNA-directed RNA polymerase subunit RPC12/RpoP